MLPPWILTTAQWGGHCDHPYSRAEGMRYTEGKYPLLDSTRSYTVRRKVGLDPTHLFCALLADYGNQPLSSLPSSSQCSRPFSPCCQTNLQSFMTVPMLLFPWPRTTMAAFCPFNKTLKCLDFRAIYNLTQSTNPICFLTFLLQKNLIKERIHIILIVYVI